jgi:hypothetical protein
VRGGHLLSDNLYWLAKNEADYRAMDDMPKVALTGAARRVKTDAGTRVELDLRNPARTPVLLVKATLRDAQGARVLPAYAHDGYFSILPGEIRRLTIETPSTAPDLQVTLDGWNTTPATLPVQ